MQHINGARVPTVTADAIRGFFGAYRFLSNFHQAPLVLDGVTYASSEHAYMAQKTTDPELRRAIANAETPSKAKALGRAVPLRSDWDSYRLVAMLAVLTAKFSDPELGRLLLLTGDRYLEETNDWGDRYWGVDGHGSNFLGQLLMLVRSNLRLQHPEWGTPQETLF